MGYLEYILVKYNNRVEYIYKIFQWKYIKNNMENQIGFYINQVSGGRNIKNTQNSISVV